MKNSTPTAAISGRSRAVSAITNALAPAIMGIRMMPALVVAGCCCCGFGGAAISMSSLGTFGGDSRAGRLTSTVPTHTTSLTTQGTSPPSTSDIVFGEPAQDNPAGAVTAGGFKCQPGTAE